MTLLDPTYIRDNCDYSFGDQSGAGIYRGYMKYANIHNSEFISKYNEALNKGHLFMTLFIDNIRLYKRDGIKYTAMEQMNQSARDYKDKVVRELMMTNNLLELCSQLPNMKFVIFTGFEDTPIDDEIYDKIPDNVIGIYASNAISFGGKVVPIPYGIQRMLYVSDIRQEILKKLIESNDEPTKLLYLNHSISNNPERMNLNSNFEGKTWATIKTPISIDPVNYFNFLRDIKSHKFMICPDGNAIGCECHRDWEVLYMRRVPVVKRSKYLEYIFKDFPVLFVDKFSDVTEELLLNNDHLYLEAQNLDLAKLDMSKIYNDIINNLKK